MKGRKNRRLSRKRERKRDANLIFRLAKRAFYPQGFGIGAEKESKPAFLTLS